MGCRHPTVHAGILQAGNCLSLASWPVRCLVNPYDGAPNGAHWIFGRRRCCWWLLWRQRCGVIGCWLASHWRAGRSDCSGVLAQDTSLTTVGICRKFVALQQTTHTIKDEQVAAEGCCLI